MRVSALMGREGESFHSPELQRQKIEAWATYRGYEIVAWYVDLDVSGRAGTRRPEFDRMMADARAGAFHAIAVYRLTRFGRSVADAARHYAELERHDVDLVSVTEDIDTTTAGGKFMRNVLFAMAEFESERIGEEWRNVHAARRARGIAHVARPVLGYTIEGARIVGVDEEEARAVRLAYELRAQGVGYGAIRAHLEREGHRPKNGHARFSQSTVSRILSNPLYAGRLRDPSGGSLPADHAPLVPVETWERVQALGGRANVLARHKAGLLSGLLVCSGCGYHLAHERHAGGGRWAREHPSSGRPVYRCASRARAERCPRAVSVRADYAEEWVQRVFLARFDVRRMPGRGRARGVRHLDRAGHLEARAVELDAALDALADQRFVKGSMDAGEYERQFARYATERAEAVATAGELRRRAAGAEPPPRDLLDTWDVQPLEARQRALRLAVDQVEVLPSPRKGAGQRQLIPDRLRIVWV